MAYKVPTLDEMMQFGVALFKALFPSRNVGSRFSFYWKLVKVLAGMVTDVHANLTNAGNNFMPDKTSGAYLDRWLAIVGLIRKSATPARKAAALRITGTIATPIPYGSQLLHRASGQTFQVNNAAGTAIGGGGTIDADIIGISVGSSTRLKKGETLEFITPIGGVQQYAKLVLDLDEDGYDAELDGAALVRLLKALGEPTSGGNQADFVRWSLAAAGVSAAYCYPNRAGIGSVDIAALHTGTGATRFLNSGERAVLLAWLQTLAPSQLAGTGGALRVLTTVGENVNVDIAITTNGEAAYAFDWDDGGISNPTPATVLTWTAGTLTVQLNAARPATMKAGDRVCFYGVTNVDQSGAPIVIESLVSTDSFKLSALPTKRDGTTATLGAGDIVFAGGKLTAPLRDAIIAHVNSDVLYAHSTGPLPGAVAAAQGLSTANLQVLLEGIGTSNPNGKYGAWSGALRRGAIDTIAMYTKGVRGLSIISPTVDTESTDYAFPIDDQIGMLSMGSVYVRKA